MIWIARASALPMYTHICMCSNAYSTKEQVKIRLASTVHLIVEVIVPVANGYNERYCKAKLAINNCFFGGAEDGELFSCPPRTGSSRYLLISLQLLVLSIAIVTSTVTVCACVKSCSNSSDTLNANNFHVL